MGEIYPFAQKHPGFREKFKKRKERFHMFKSNGGFTLVELIVVIAILAILAGVAVPAYSAYITNANDSAVESELVNVLTAAQSAAAMMGEEVAKIEVSAAGVVVAYIEDQDATDNESGDAAEFDTLDITKFFDGDVASITKHSEFGANGATWYPAADDANDIVAGWNAN